jgi:hypothetical protein
MATTTPNSNSFLMKKRMTTTMTAIMMAVSPPHRIKIRCPQGSDDEESDGDIDSMDAADNALKEDELEPTIDDNHNEVGLSCFKVKDLDNHGRK